jgi:ribose transport system substrate-binding protein
MKILPSLSLAVLCFVVELIGPSGCEKPRDGAQDAGAPASHGAPAARILGVSVQTMTNPFFVDLTDGLREVVEKNGDRLMVLDAQFDSLRQKNDVSDLILRGAAAIFLNPVNWEGIRGSLVQARDKGIPVIVVDAPVRDEDLVLCTVASDNLEAGRLAARALSAAASPARIGVLSYSINKACIDRVAGFKEELAKHPNCRIEAELELESGTSEKARPVLRDMIGRHPDLNAIFAINDPAAIGAISALESSSKLAGVKVAAVDGADEAVRAILDGKMLSSSAQFPREIGKASAEAAYEHFAGKSVRKNIQVRVELITKNNAAAFAKK